MSTTRILEREEYIEQAYFFRGLRERLTANLAVQDVLLHLDQEILSTTRLPYAIQFLAAEVKHSGLLSSGFARLGHYFTAFQAFIVQATEDEALRLNIDSALLVLQREAEFRADRVTPAGLFVYQFEVLSRNRLGYEAGIAAMAADPVYDADWSAFITTVGQQVGLVDFADLLFYRSDLQVAEQRRLDPTYEPAQRTLFGDKEGKIARANRGRDPLYLFSALQRQLGYPEVPRPRPRDDTASKIEVLQVKVRELESRLKLLDSEVRGQLDLEQLKRLGKPELFSLPDED
jgi:hypothetical protein